MSTLGMGVRLLGDLVPDAHLDGQEDEWVTIREFCERSHPADVVAAAREIQVWLDEGTDEEHLLEVYLDAGANTAPDEGEPLRAYLERIRDYLFGFGAQRVGRAVGAHPGLPADLVARVVREWGDRGLAWLSELPGLVEAAAARWGVTIGEPLPSHRSLVLAVRQSGGEPAVLRAAFRGWPESCALPSLEAWGGNGAVRLLADDPVAGVCLLERASPGAALSGLVPTDDVKATEVVGALLGRLWRAEQPAVELPGLNAYPPPFATYLDVHGGRGPLPQPLVVDAGRMLGELLASSDESGPPVLLHGNLHHGNVLSSASHAGGWVAVDPKGMLGDRCYDLAAMLRQPTPWVGQHDDPGAVLRRRLYQLSSQLGVDEDRARAWAFVTSVRTEVEQVARTGAPHGTPLRVAEALRRQM